MHQIFQSFLRDLETHKRDEQNKNRTERYHVSCWETCKAINTALDKLLIAEKLLSNSYKYIPDGESHNLGKYIEFHIENYMIRSRSVYDRALIFTNALCDIGINKEYINQQVICTNEKVIESGLKPKLKSINTACQTYRTERNGLIHHDKYINENLEWLTTAKQSLKLVGGDHSILGITEEQIINMTADIVVEHLQSFQENTKKIHRAVNEFLDHSIKVYDLNAQTAVVSAQT